MLNQTSLRHCKLYKFALWALAPLIHFTPCTGFPSAEMSFSPTSSLMDYLHIHSCDAVSSTAEAMSVIGLCMWDVYCVHVTRTWACMQIQRGPVCLGLAAWHGRVWALAWLHTNRFPWAAQLQEPPWPRLRHAFPRYNYQQLTFQIGREEETTTSVV